MSGEMIQFNKAAVTGEEQKYIGEVLKSGKMAGDGPVARRCEDALKHLTRAKLVLLTPSCTAALEMAAILCGVSPGDEVIVPSYTFVSSALAFVMRGAKIVFVDICPQTMNLDLDRVEAAITDKTKVVVPVHYAGTSCDMDRLMALSERYGFYVVEDAAQALMSQYKDRSLGTIGHFGCFSFHETKNYTAGGEGGALLVNRPKYAARAEVLREKGTDRKAFFNGMVDKYTWRDLGSSFLMSELQAAYLLAQLENASKINDRRLTVWSQYWDAFGEVMDPSRVQLPHVPAYNEHNAHMFYLKLPSQDLRQKYIGYMKQEGVYCPFHYVPLHSSPMGMESGSFFGEDVYTSVESSRLVRLPIFYNIEQDEINYVIDKTLEFYSKELVAR